MKQVNRYLENNKMDAAIPDSIRICFVLIAHVCGFYCLEI